MKQHILSGLLKISVLSLALPLTAQSFTTSDLEGTWYGYEIAIDPTTPAVFWLRGTATLDAAGNFLSGTYVTPDGSAIPAVGGKLTLDRKGVLSGSFTIGTGATVTVVHGKLDQSGTNATFVGASTDDGLDIGHYFKSGGNFAASDLQGTWYGYQTIIVPETGAVFWVYGTIAVDASGNVSGSFTAADGRTLSVDSGTLSIDSNGILGGSWELSSDITGPLTGTIAHGKIDHGKTKGAFVSIASDGSLSLGHLVKAGGSFQPGDGEQGNWYTYGLNIDPSVPAVYWVYGEMKFDASGKDFTGTYIAPTGESATVAGAITTDSGGVATGSYSSSTGENATIVSLKLDQGKTSSVGVDVAPASGAMTILYPYKESYFVINPAIPALLLGDDEG